MKHLFLLALLCAALSASAQTFTVPDANFRNFLDNTFAGTTVSGNDITFTTPSAASIGVIDCPNQNITDLTGIEAFTGLFSLNCSNNQLTSLNVSSNTALTTLNCSVNQLTSLDISTNTSLIILLCFNNQLTSLNVSNNSALTSLNCGGNQLTTLDVSNNSALTSLTCNTNQLTTLDVSNSSALTSLNCSFNQLTTLDVSNNSALTNLTCNTNQLTTLDVSNNTMLDFLNCQANRIPIVLTDGSVSSITKDAITQVATFRSSSLNPSIPAAQTGGFVLGTTGAILNLTANTGGTGSLSSSTSTNPTIVGGLPSGTTNISPDQFWRVDATGVVGTYNLILNLTGITNITNFNTLQVLKRDNASAPWQNVAAAPISATVQYLQPFIIVNGLTSFSDFAIGSAGDNPLPVALGGFTGSGINGKVSLAWRTISEINNAGFALLRDGQSIASYTSFPTLRGGGTTNTERAYAFTDNSVEVGKTYRYQLRSFDFDGTIHDYPDALSVEVSGAASVPTKYALEQNYPNPFNPTTAIRYALPNTSQVSLKVYDVLGREVATLVNARQAAGEYTATFNAANVASGLYFYRLEASSFVQTKKMMLVK